MGFKQSFYDWCIDNNRKDLLDRWNYELNINDPKNVAFTSHNKFYFNCDRHANHRPTLVCLASLTSSGQNIRCSECNSFAQWVIDNYDQGYLNKIWNMELNSISPWEVSAKSHYDIYLNCDKVEYHKGYKTCAARFTSGQKICGFCHGLQVRPLDSFAAFGKNTYGDDFLERYWDYEKNNVNPYEIAKAGGTMVWLKCQDKTYHDSYLVRVSDFSLGKSKCPYCRGLKVNYFDSVGYKYPMIFDFWSEKNNLTPYDYTIHSAKRVWLKCNDGIHNDYQKQIRDAIGAGFHCPQCVNLRNESYLEEAVRIYLSNEYQYRLEHEYTCSVAAINPDTGRKLPYDNEVLLPNNIHLIIEVHGKQHYMITHLTVLSAKQKGISAEDAFKQQKKRDKIKKDYINSLQNYFFMEVPYWSYIDESYKTLIDDKIKSILNNPTLTCAS